ncbi:hypothetical protein KR093_009482, partial [Drosophila rubida]
TPPKKRLNGKQFDDLTKWLETKNIDLINYLGHGSIDLNSVVTIVKTINKKMPAVGPYTVQNNHALKLKNWENFNLLALRKLGVIVTRPALEDLASGDLSALQYMLHQLMLAERKGFQVYVPRRSGTLIPSDNQMRTFRVSKPMTIKQPGSNSNTNQGRPGF